MSKVNHGYNQNRIMAGVKSSPHMVTAVLNSAAEKNIMWPFDKDVFN